MPRAKNIRTKLALALTVPWLGMAGVVAYEILTSTGLHAPDAGTSDTARLNAAMVHERVLSVAMLASFLVAVLLTWLVSRSITRPLVSLRRQAEDMAASRLPAAVRQTLDTPLGEDVVMPQIEPIAVSSRDEVGVLAKALNVVQERALDLAVEQAVLRRNISDSYSNLGRRNQNLLSRQIDFITDLERNESDPDTLEGLFRLDHLATRMRRNAESLLVLAGIEAPRQWAEPVQMSDVARSALGEVEDYRRVVIRHLEPAAVDGAIAADMAHLAAELIENALSFSPGDQQVEITGRLGVDGYSLVISDNGYGMPAAELARANRRVAGGEALTVAPSRYLGHYVVGHLASRHGIAVALQPSAAGGVSAQVDLPMSLLADEETDRNLATVRAARPTAPPASTPENLDLTQAVPAPPRPAAVAEEPTPAPTTSTAFTLHGLPRRGEQPVDSADSATSAAPPEVTPGFGGLAMPTPQGPSLFTVTARNAREAATPPSDADTSSTGLARRVPGAQRPDAADREITWPAVGKREAEPASSTPDEVYNFLSSFQSGVDRGRAEAHDGRIDPPEGER